GDRLARETLGPCELSRRDRELGALDEEGEPRRTRALGPRERARRGRELASRALDLDEPDPGVGRARALGRRAVASLGLDEVTPRVRERSARELGPRVARKPRLELGRD